MANFRYAEVIEGVVTRRKTFKLKAPFAESELKLGADGFPLLRPVITVKPSYDSTIEVREGPVTTIQDLSITDTWTVRAMTQLELDAYAEANSEAQVVEFNPVLMKVLHNFDTRLRALESRPSKTGAEFRAILKGLI